MQDFVNCITFFKYLDRKYSRFARYRGNTIDERDNIGEGCDANTELTD